MKSKLPITIYELLRVLSKKYRLPGYLIRQVIKEGRTLVTPLFVLKFLPLSTLQQFNNFPPKADQPRAGTMKQWSNSLFAFIISKKLDKSAVVRNKAKRRLSEAVRHLLPQMTSSPGKQAPVSFLSRCDHRDSKIKPGVALVFLTKREILEKTYQEIFEQIKEVIKQLSNETMKQ